MPTRWARFRDATGGAHFVTETASEAVSCATAPGAVL